LTVERLIELLATNAQRFFGLRPAEDTYTLVDLDASYVIERSQLRTQCGWSPFEGMRVYGRVTEVRIRGQLAFDGESVSVPAGFGRDLAHHAAEV
jgi:dihydroorotase-like cyclic amidohydrolase